MAVFRFFFDHKILAAFAVTAVLQSVAVLSSYLPEAPQEELIEKVVRTEAPTQTLKVARLQSPPATESKLMNADQKLSQRTYKVVSGDTLTKIWTKNADSYTGGILAAKALKARKIPLSIIRAGDELTLQLNEEGDIIRFEKALGDGQTLVLKGNSIDGYEAERLTQKIIETERVASGIISQNFSNAASTASVPYEVIDELVDLFGTRVEFRRDLQPGDSFSIVYIERSLESGEKISPGPILAASLQNSGELLAAVRHVGSDNKPRYYDEGGKPLGNYFLRYPLKFTRISSVFNKSRFHPILKRRRPHNGVDFAAPTGTPVRAVADGVVITAAYNGGAGKMVKITHGSRWATAYLHLSRISSGIKKGVRVKRGQVIGKVGSTGYATGPHLHYSLYDRGRYVDPLKVTLPSMPTDAKPIPAEILQAAVRRLSNQHEKLQYAQSQKRRAHA